MELSRLNRPERANLTHFPVQLPPPKQEQAALLRLCTYNVRIDHPLDQEGAHSWDARKDAIIRECVAARQKDADENVQMKAAIANHAAELQKAQTGHRRSERRLSEVSDRLAKVGHFADSVDDDDGTDLPSTSTTTHSLIPDTD